MAQRPEPEPITVRTDKLAEIDALAGAMGRSRNDIVNQAIEQYLQANAWQMERISDGVAAVRDGKVMPADDVFAGIAAKHGWQR
ncbi:CopG family ribbon-helix-helix protein [Marinicauda sp. Alg238-R41]|uniref:CopG family ribbon-helix-helix protein n=1 Tax=Marinicauda sp. Alg238-R41 TaxID=2993447 RepID=UPI0022E7CF8E|nr:ribbon-helix-helix domain-containing protein [Marinicauda sp. Alg238-R41]